MSESGPVPGGRPGEAERATALSGEPSGQGGHGVVPASGRRPSGKGRPGRCRSGRDADEPALPAALRIARRVYRLPGGLMDDG